MSDTPLVSYLVPAYNHAEYVAQTIESVLAQDYPSIELIVCDDFSADGTFEVLNEALQHHSFRLLRNETNCGVRYTLNRMIDAAQGEYLGILASDDWIDPAKTSAQVTFLEETGMDAVVGPVRVYIQDTGISVDRDLAHLQRIFDESRYLEFIYQTISDGALVQSGLFRHEPVRKIGGFLTEYVCDDWLFMIRFMRAGYRVGLLNVPLTNYRIHSANSYKNAVYWAYHVRCVVDDGFVPAQYRRKFLSSLYHETAMKLLCKNRWLSAGYELRSVGNRPQQRYIVTYIKSLLMTNPAVRAIHRAMKRRSPRVQRRQQL